MKRIYLDREQIKSEYASGLGLKKIGVVHNVSADTVKRNLLDAGVNLRPRGGHAGRAFPCDELFFDDLSRESPAYWLGFIMADGYVRKRRPHWSGELAIYLVKDKEHLESFAEDVDFRGQVLSTTQNRYYVRICNEYVYQRLVSLGVDPGTKSYTLKFPDHIPDCSMRHFLRGYLDGDGGLYYNSRNISVASTESFLRGFQGELSMRLSAGGCLHNIKDNAAWRLVYGGRIQCAKIARFLYGDCSVALQRKLEVAQRMMAMS